MSSNHIHADNVQLDMSDINKILQIDVQDAMKKALDISGNHVMCLDLRSNKVYDLHGKALFGNHVGIDICYTYIHPDDRPGFQDFIERLSKGVVKEAECRYRWDYNYTGKGEPEWHNMHSSAIAEYEDGVPVNIIATLTDETEKLREAREMEKLSERYRFIFENSIIGLSFYSPEGWLLDANRIMREICHFDSENGDEFFSHVNLFDISPFNEILDRYHPEDYWACSLSIIPERNMRVYLEISVHPIYSDDGKLLYIAVSANDVTEERNMYLQVLKNEAQIKEAKKSIQMYESELRYMLQACQIQAWRINLERDQLEFFSDLSTVVRSFSLKQMQKIFVNQDDEFVKALSNPSEALAKPLSYVGQMHPVVSQSTSELQWVQINCIPEYDEQGKLKGSFGVWRNVTDLMNKQEMLRRETMRAKDSVQMKSMFLSNIAHEIRTPLNAIVGFCELLSMQSESTADEKQELLDVIMDNCDMLLRLIDDIQVASDIGDEGVEIIPAEVDFAKAFDSFCLTLAKRVQNPAVEFQKDSPLSSFVITTDTNRLRQVATNFVTNAVKYTRQGHIRLGWRPMSSDELHGMDSSMLASYNARAGVYIYCEDTGAGIEADMQERVFERFFKVNDFVQGTGLGLSICKSIATALHGDIGVKSEGRGKGSTFWIWIPTDAA
ncbi:MAG: PAS domain-containing sensor histidine kinase [Bacteroidaceae bacterium]|nr:PAS domain-containing sensor histidine kinase [Bacteroidaceae bacterium]